VGWLRKEIWPAMMTASGVALTATGNPEGIPMLAGGLSSGLGQGIGGSTGEGIAGIGALSSLAGGMMGGSPSTADAAAAAGRTPSTDVMQSAMGAPGGTTALPEMAPAGRGIFSVAPVASEIQPAQLAH